MAVRRRREDAVQAAPRLHSLRSRGALHLFLLPDQLVSDLARPGLRLVHSIRRQALARIKMTINQTNGDLRDTEDEKEEGKVILHAAFPAGILA